jgi:hypothetical protein
MGTAVSANDEWIELYNDSASAVSLDGWTLSSVDGTPNIALTGTVGASSYFLLERTSDDTVLGVAADQIYVGSLSNAGEVLLLTDSGGTVIDTVDGSGNWALGGDNTTKDTLQRIGGVWVTGKPTPGRVNTSEQTQPVPDEAAETTTNQKTNTTPTTKTTTSTATSPTLTSPKKTNTPTLAIEAYNTGTVGVPISFVAHATDNNITWVFGDGATGQGSSVSHTYLYEGNYVVVVKGAAGTDTFEITITKSHLEFGTITGEFVEVKNAGDSTVDLSGWLLTEGTHTFVFPQGTQILKGAAIRLPVSVTHLMVVDPQHVALYYPNETLAIFSGNIQVGETKQAVTTAELMAPASKAVGQQMTIKKVANNTSVNGQKNELIKWASTTAGEEVPPEEFLAAASVGQKTSTPLYIWLIGLSALCVGAVAVVLLLQKDSREHDEVATTLEE